MADVKKNQITKNQAIAIQRDCSRLTVKAGAGSGKTSVLVQRYLRLVIEEEISPLRILASTFTEKAAAEIKERIAIELNRAGKEEMIAELNAAPIGTLHAFCSRLIAPRTLSLGLDPGYQILDSDESRILQEECLSDILTRWRGERREDLQRIIKQLHWSGEYGLRRGRTPTSRGFSRQFLDFVEAVRCGGAYSEEPFQPLDINPENNRERTQDLLFRLGALLAQPNTYPAKSLEKAQDTIHHLKKFLLINDVQNSEILEHIEALGGINLTVSAGLKEALTLVKTDLYPLLMDQYYSADYESLRIILNDLYRDFRSHYWDKKRGMGVLDFLDLEEIALDILKGDSIDTGIDHIIIDETQDLNPTQWQLIDLLSRKATVFVVGDIQQSIYGFRHADVQLFSKFISQMEDPIILERNFRSRSSVLHLVNTLFESRWEKTEGSGFVKLEAGYKYSQRDGDEVELLLASGEDREEAREAEASHLASRIYEIVKGCNYTLESPPQEMRDQREVTLPRLPQWRDVMVLVRSSRGFEYLERAFSRRNIPYVVSAGRGFWDAPEIADLLALLRALENPGDSLSLACVLRSPVVGFSDDDLLALCVDLNAETPEEADNKTQYRPLYEGLGKLADEKAISGSLPGRCADFIHIFNELYQLKDRIPLRELLDIWIEAVDLENYWATEPMGQSMRSNVRKFLRLCDAYVSMPATKMRTLFEEIRTREMQESLSTEPLSGSGAVRIMTVHAAKGLEAPVVALFDMNYSPKPSHKAFIYTCESGASFSILAGKDNSDRHVFTLTKNISEQLKKKENSEEERVLYVALTRAREKLLLSASCKVAEDKTVNANGWWKIFMEGMKVDSKLLFNDTNLSPSFFPLINDQGEDTGIKWKYTTQEASLPTPSPGDVELWSPASEIPPNFPVLPVSVKKALSVVKWLRSQQEEQSPYPFDDDEELNADGDEGQGLTIGRLVHRVLQVIPLQISDDELFKTIRTQGMYIFHRTLKESDIYSTYKLVKNFYQSDLAGRIRKTEKIFREFPIIFEAEGILFQGKVDLAFLDADGWTLVDYKTNRVEASNLDSIISINQYEDQLILYAIGWEKLTGQKPEQAQLAFLHPNRIIPVDLTKPKFDRLIELLRRS